MLQHNLREEVNKLAAADGMELSWEDDHRKLGEQIIAGTFGRWIRYRPNPTGRLQLMAKDLYRLLKSGVVQPVIASGPFFYMKERGSFWWCDFGTHDKEESHVRAG